MFDEPDYIKDIEWFFPRYKVLKINIEVFADMIVDGYTPKTTFVSAFRLAQYISWRSKSKLSVWDAYKMCLNGNIRN